jgi:hypothetical protein
MDSLPEELQFRNISSKKKTILEKQQRQVLPSNGTEQTANFSSGPQIVFRVPIDNEWSIQMDSAHIIADLQVKGLSAEDSYDNLKRTQTNIDNATKIPILAPCESYESFIYRIAVYLNGSELERIDNYSYLETFKHNWCNNQNWVNLMSGGMGLGQSILEKSKLLLGGLATDATSSNTIQIGFPLRYLGLMNIKTLLPAYLLGPNSLEIRIWLAPASECFTYGSITNTANNNYRYINWTPNTANAISYTLSNIHMNINYIQTEPSYNNALSQYLVSNNLQIPIETYFMTQFPISRGQNGWVTQNISVQYSNINSIYLIFTRNTEQGTVAYLGTDRMHAIEGLSQARLTVNGKVLPSVPIQFQNPGYLTYPDSTVSISNTTNGLLTSGVNGQALCQQPEALNYLMKALGYNTSAEMLGQVNFPVVDASPLLLTSPTAANGNNVQSIYNKVGAGAFYASNKAVHQFMLQSAADTSSTPSGRTLNPFSNEEIFWKTPTMFALGWTMTRSDYSDEFELSGYNASSNSGIVQVGLQFGAACKDAKRVTAAAAAAASAALSSVTPIDNYTCWVIIEHTRVLDIGKDNAQVLY